VTDASAARVLTVGDGQRPAAIAPYSSSSESSGTSLSTDLTQGLPKKMPAGTILDVALGRELRQKNKLDYRNMCVLTFAVLRNMMGYCAVWAIREMTSVVLMPSKQCV
jgi:hypothetical protein